MTKALKLVDQIGGEVRAVATQGQYVYMGMGYRVIVLDATDPLHPRLVGRSEPLGWVVDALRVDGHRLLAELESQVAVLDLRDPTRPKRVGRFGVWEHIRYCALGGRYAYAIDRDWDGAEFTVFDLVHPSRPKLIVEYDAMPFARTVRRSKRRPSGAPGVNALVTQEGLAYVATSSGLAIFDVGTPDRPTHLSSLDIGWSFDAIAVAGNRAGLTGNRGVAFCDVSDPRRPELLGRFGRSGGMSSIYLTPELACATDYDGLRIFDLSDPVSPRELDDAGDLGFTEASSVAVIGERVYVLDSRERYPSSRSLWQREGGAGFRPGGLRVLRRGSGGFISGPNYPVNLTEPYGLWVTGSQLFVRGKDATHLVSLVDPDEPGLERTVDGLNGLGKIVPVGRYGYAATQDGFAVVDISRPTKARRLSAYPLPGGADDVFVRVPHAFVVAGSRMVVLDISRPRRVQLVGEVVLPDSGDCVAVIEDHAYVGSWDRYFVVDVSDPTSPKLVRDSSSPYLGWLERLEAGDGRLYALHDESLTVLDPFCGGGSIPLEAQRLGLEAHASDLNPVAVLIPNRWDDTV